MSKVKSVDNRSTEILLIQVLRNNAISGWRRKYALYGKPDFVFLKERVAVFVDGCFWHGHPQKCRIPKTNRQYWVRKIERNIDRDKKVNRHLKDKGWKVVRIWEDAINKTSTVVRLRRVLGR